MKLSTLPNGRRFAMQEWSPPADNLKSDEPETPIIYRLVIPLSDSNFQMKLYSISAEKLNSKLHAMSKNSNFEITCSLDKSQAQDTVECPLESNRESDYSTDLSPGRDPLIYTS
jgi:hypothetical protein